MSDMGAGKTGEQEQGAGIAETVSEQATKAKDKGRSSASRRVRWQGHCGAPVSRRRRMAPTK